VKPGKITTKGVREGTSFEKGHLHYSAITVSVIVRVKGGGGARACQQGPVPCSGGIGTLRRWFHWNSLRESTDKKLPGGGGKKLWKPPSW